VQDVPVSQRGRMTPGGLIAVPTTGPQAGVHLASCPGQLTIRAGATCRLERGKHADPPGTGLCASNVKMPVLNQARCSLAAVGENSRIEGQNVRKDSWVARFDESDFT
jgi:hypothetical protein